MQYNIYFRKDNWDSFKDEPNKSELVNELLARYYGKGGSVNIKTNPDKTISPRNPNAPSSFERPMGPSEPQGTPITSPVPPVTLEDDPDWGS